MHPKCLLLIAALWMAFGVSTAVADGSAGARHGKDGRDSAYATSASNQFVRVAASVQENYTTRTLTETGTLTLCNGTNGWKIAVFDDDKWDE